MLFSRFTLVFQRFTLFSVMDNEASGILATAYALEMGESIENTHFPYSAKSNTTPLWLKGSGSFQGQNGSYEQREESRVLLGWGERRGPLLGGDLNEQPNKAALFPHQEGPTLEGPWARYGFSTPLFWWHMAQLCFLCFGKPHCFQCGPAEPSIVCAMLDFLPALLHGPAVPEVDGNAWP